MKVLFVDRDGTLINEPPGGYIDSLGKLKIFSFVIQALQKLQLHGYKFIMISNQPGRGTNKFPEANFIIPQNKLMEIFSKNNISFEETFFCPHFREDQCTCMKPKTGLIDSFLKKNFNIKESYVIGDRETDLKLAKNIGCKGIFYSEKDHPYAVFTSKDWNKISEFILHTNCLEKLL